ncbi:hypothetical protein LTR53_007790 [Teratosphaeriaceae sp. CCFEE 6253]|nr:hypothetical protein LTR53_007790 [Teratosphaeriaceae sp. CCFEE 6253]
MSNIEYAHCFTSDTETVIYPHVGLTITRGAWVRETIDHVLPAPQNGTSNWRFLTYEPLPDDSRVTRVLQLEPGGFLDPVRGHLLQCRLSERGASHAYVALSYAWGDWREQCAVFVNDRPLAVTASLGRALRQVRSKTAAVTVWADAICINQDDIMERSGQVAIMMDIFAAATRVLAWLGPETQHTAVCMQMLKYMLEVEPGVGHAPWELLPASMLQPGIADIVERNYFKRLWVVQEAAVAAEVTLACGSHSIQWRNTAAIVRRFERSVKLAGISPQWQALGLPDLDSLLQLLQLQLSTGPEAALYKQMQPRQGLLDVLYSMRHRQVSDPRDRYYALLGLTERNGVGRLLQIDYLQPVEEVYRQVIEAIMREEFPNSEMIGSDAGASPSTGSRVGAGSTSTAPSLFAILASQNGDASCAEGDSRNFADLGDSVGADETRSQLVSHGQQVVVDIAGNSVSKDTPADRRAVLSAHVQSACAKATALIDEGQFQRAAALLLAVARGVENGDG